MSDSTINLNDLLDNIETLVRDYLLDIGISAGPDGITIDGDLCVTGTLKPAVAGPQGPAGEDGADGQDGADGATGPAGPQGPQGEAGGLN